MLLRYIRVERLRYLRITRACGGHATSFYIYIIFLRLIIIINNYVLPPLYYLSNGSLSYRRENNAS